MKRIVQLHLAEPVSIATRRAMRAGFVRFVRFGIDDLEPLSHCESAHIFRLHLLCTLVLLALASTPPPPLPFSFLLWAPVLNLCVSPLLPLLPLHLHVPHLSLAVKDLEHVVADA